MWQVKRLAVPLGHEPLCDETHRLGVELITSQALLGSETEQETS